MIENMWKSFILLKKKKETQFKRVIFIRE